MIAKRKHKQICGEIQARQPSWELTAKKTAVLRGVIVRAEAGPV